MVASVSEVTEGLLSRLLEDPAYVTTVDVKDILALGIPSEEKAVLLAEIRRLKSQVCGASGSSGNNIFVVAPGWRVNREISTVGDLGLRFVANYIKTVGLGDLLDVPDTELYGVALRFPQVEIWYRGKKVPNYWDL